MNHFVHLHCHTDYSIVDGLIPIKTLIKSVHDKRMPACAITDQGNLFALVKFYQAAQSAGIKPIIGVDLRLKNDSQISRLVLLCQNDIGYRNLTRLVSRTYTQGQTLGKPYLLKEWLTSHNTQGLIALSGGQEGELGPSLLAGNWGQAKQQLTFWHSLFPQRFYLQLQRIGRPQEEEYLQAAVELALATATPVVASNAVCFVNAEDFEAHEVRVSIHEGYTLDDPNRPRHYTPQQYLRSPEEMSRLFADLPEALENTGLIAQRCNLELSLGKNFLPDFPIPQDLTLSDYFREQARLGLQKRLATFIVSHEQTVYWERLELELNVIMQMGFPGYFLIVADFIQWAKSQEIPVGPGRGSGAGSLVAYALGITDLDPLRYDLLFERFLNPERVSMPDFDIDFCMERRDEVIDYVAKRYGRDRVSQIITYGTMAAKAVVRDVGRVQGHPHGFVDKIAKLIPFELGITLDKALKDEESLRTLYEQQEEVRLLIDMARKLEGLTRNPGKHAGGVVIAPSELTDFAPLYCEEDGSNLVTQFDKDDIERIGLVKFDFLGLRTLTIIKWAVDSINQLQPGSLDILNIPLDDPKTFELLKRAKTTAVFQLESTGLKKLIKRLQPDCFEDIIALVALYRPGPLQSGMVDDFIDRKQGRAKIEYPHPTLAHILKPTYGVIVYQEQVMQIAQVLSGYTLGNADLLRRAMGKKKPEEMAKQRSLFVEGARARQVPEATATAIFDLMEKFAAYGFNKSHSAAYALVSYQTAWLKAHYPAAFMAAVLSADLDNQDKIVTLLEECRVMGLSILPAAINHSAYQFKVTESTKSQAIRYGLGAIKGVGEAATLGILEERQQRGPFSDLFSFCERIDLRKANRRVLEALIKSGALDELGPHRASLLASLDSAIKLAERQSTDQATGQNDIFSLQAVEKSQKKLPPFVNAAPWSLAEQLRGEKESLGFYLSGHPISRYQAELQQWVRIRLGEVRPTGPKQKVKVAGWVTELRHGNSKRGRMASLVLEDLTGHLEVTVFSEEYGQFRDRLSKDTVLLVEGEVYDDDYSGGYVMSASQVTTLDQEREKRARCLEIKIKAGQISAQTMMAILKPYCSGRCVVVCQYQYAGALVELVLGENWRVRPDQALLDQLQELLGEDKVRLTVG